MTQKQLYDKMVDLEVKIAAVRARVAVLELPLPTPKPLDPGTRVCYTRHLTPSQTKTKRVGTVVPRPKGCAFGGLSGEAFTYVVWDGESVAYGAYGSNLEVVP